MFTAADFSKEQNDLIQSRKRRILVDAGAGSGKTRTLIGRIVSLLEGNTAAERRGRVDLSRIVAITFTEKAALEMKTRLRGECRDRARAAMVRDAAVDWQAIERDVENARISTIHSFCAGLLRQHALLLGINPDARVLDNTETRLLFSDYLEGALNRLLREEDPDTLLLCESLGLVKTRDMLETLMKLRVRVRQLLEDRAELCGDPADLQTYWLQDRRAVQLYVDRLRRGRQFRQLLDLIAKELTPLLDMPKVPAVLPRKIKCVESVFDAVLSHPERLDQEIASFKSNWTAAGRFISKAIAGYEDKKEILKKIQDYINENLLILCQEDEAAGNIIPESANLTVSLGRLFQRIEEGWRDFKDSENALDFDDLIVLVRDHLRTNEQFREVVQRGIAYLLVDEQQDTDPVQVEIFDLICAGENGPDLFMVGDVNQSIYRFRGAEVSVFARQALRQDTHKFKLVKNYRCQGALLAFVNDFFRSARMLQQYGDYRELEVGRDALPGTAIEVFVVPGYEGDVRLNAQEKVAREAEFIAARILHWTGNADRAGETGGGDLPAAYEYRDFAILLRQGTHAGAFEEALRRRGIPVTVHVGATFYQQQEVLDCAALARFALNGYDEAALITVLRSPFVGVTDDDLLRLRMRADELNMPIADFFHSDEVPENLDHPDRLAWARELYRHLSGARHLGAGAFFRRLFELTEVETLALGLPHGFEIRANLRKMCGIAESFGSAGTSGLRAFVNGLDQFIRAGMDEGEANLHGGQVNAVRILSIHKAKGLEFPVVFLPQTDIQARSSGNQLVWHPELGMVLAPDSLTDIDKNGFVYQRVIKKMDDLDDQAERERLLYVAMTRAKDRLLICVPEKCRSNTWAEDVYSFLDLENRADGAVVDGSGWQARIWKSVPKGCMDSATLPDQQSDEEKMPAIVSRETGSTPEIEIPVISVTRLLNLMGTRETEEDEDRGDLADTVSLPDEVMLSAGRRLAVRRGTLVHRFFELWRDFSGSPPDAERLLRELRVVPSRRDFLRRSLMEVTRLFEVSTLRDRLARDVRARREYPFYFRLEQTVVRGTLDWLGSDGLILDYKTGHLTEEKLKRYRDQIALYAAAVRQGLGMGRLEGILYFTDIGKVEPVPLDDTVIENTLSRAREAVLRYQEQLRGEIA